MTQTEQDAVEPEAPDRGGRWIKFALIALVIAAGVRLAGVGLFMVDIDRKDFAVHRVDDFGTKHNCFTCLAVGAHVARHGADNIYDKARYRKAEGPNRTPVHEQIGDKVSIDSLPYPPPALLVPQLFAVFDLDFFALRGCWFALSLLGLLAGLVFSVRFASPMGEHPSLLLFPAVFLLPTVLVSLQIGNIQVLVVAMSVLAMVAFQRGRHATGAALLAYPILVKIWPAVLLVYFAFGRRWLPVRATCVAIVFYSLATLAAFGPQPFHSFFTFQLPKLISGEAFAFMKTSSHALAANMSVFGWPHKLHALGHVAEQPLLPMVLKWSYTGALALIVGIVGYRQAGRERLDRLVAVRIWLAVLTLVQLRSPFLPNTYGVLTTCWLLLFCLPGGGVFRTVLILLALAIVGADAPLLAGEGSVFGTALSARDFNLYHVLTMSGIAFLTSVVVLLPAIFGRPRDEADYGEYPELLGAVASSD